MPEFTPIANAARDLANRALSHARTLTSNGAAIDEHQVVVERVAYAATEARVIEELCAVPDDVAAYARVAAAELATSIKNRLELGARPGSTRATTGSTSRDLASPAAYEALGVSAIELAGRIAWPLDEMLVEVRDERARVRRSRDPAARRAHPPARRARARAVHHRDGEARLLRACRSPSNTAATSSATSR